MRLGKRGMEDKLTFVMWEMIVILLVVVVLTVSVRGIANNTTYWKKYHSTDMAMMTDLMFVNQGDFSINYDMKDIHKNFITKTLRIKPLVFQVFLRDNAYYLYDTSVDEDRFPQSYTFASSNGIMLINSNMTSDYIIIYKSGGEIGMKSNGIGRQVVSCSAIDTTADVTTKQFDAIGLSDKSIGYATYVTNSLDTIGTGTDKELLVGIMTNTEGLLGTYHDATSSSQGKSEKMSCLVRKQLSQKYLDTDTVQESYDNAFDNDAFVAQRDEYMYWMIVNVNESISMKELSDMIRGAINEYYGTNS